MLDARSERTPVPRAGDSPLRLPQTREVNSRPHAEAGGEWHARPTVNHCLSGGRHTTDGRGSAPLLHPVQAGHARCRTRSDHHPYKSLKSLSFISEENFTITGTIEILQRYQRQVGVRSGLSKGFRTHGRIFPVAGRLSVPEVLDPLVMREGAP